MSTVRAMRPDDTDNSAKLERRTHKRFDAYRVQGSREWFYDDVLNLWPELVRRVR